MNFENKKTYFDVAATTPLDPQVANLMHDINISCFGNPSSIHQFGQKAHNILEKSRKKYPQYLIVMNLKLFSPQVEQNQTILY